MHHCGKYFCEGIKFQSKQHDILCQRNYVERIVSSFSHLIKYEYYGGNWSIPNEGISLEYFSA